MKNTVMLLMSMSLEMLAGKLCRNSIRGAFAILLLGASANASLFGQEKDSDPEAYKLRVGGQFWYTSPTATVSGSSAQAPISFDKLSALLIIRPLTPT